MGDFFLGFGFGVISYLRVVESLCFGVVVLVVGG
jgi:hypothetical protein